MKNQIQNLVFYYAYQVLTYKLDDGIVFDSHLFNAYIFGIKFGKISLQSKNERVINRT